MSLFIEYVAQGLSGTASCWRFYSINMECRLLQLLKKSSHERLSIDTINDAISDPRRPLDEVFSSKAIAKNLRWKSPA